MLSEEEVYNGAKNWLKRNGFTVIAGQPARGIDHLPVIEIKTRTGDKGSRESYKPDLIALKDGAIYIIECKPAFNLPDYEKIQSVLNDSVRRRNLIFELNQYKLLERNGLDEVESVKGMLAYSGKLETSHTDMSHLLVKTWTGSAELFY